VTELQTFYKLLKPTSQRSVSRRKYERQPPFTGRESQLITRRAWCMLCIHTYNITGKPQSTKTKISNMKLYSFRDTDLLPTYSNMSNHLK